MLFDIVTLVLFGWLEEMIPVKVRRRLCMAGFLLGAILAGVGWRMEQSRQNCTSCSTGFYDGLVEMLMIVSGIALMFVSVWVWPWFEEDEMESPQNQESGSS